MTFENHPCFSNEARHKFARIHLPVAPACNMQCRYCNRKMDCVNESRPGVTSVVLTPAQALSYFDSVYNRMGNISVAGIAGPGDPFANPYETIETLSLIRKKYPEIILCVATNGLDLAEYAGKLAWLGAGHVTVTVNAVNPEIGERIYGWARYSKKMYRGIDAAKVIIERQEEGIRKLKEENITVKINTVVIPGINNDHVAAVAEKMSSLGADIHNCIGLYRVEGTEFADLPVIHPKMITEIRKEAGRYLPQMSHCARCRSDAAGLLGEMNSMEVNDLLARHANNFLNRDRPFVAVASMEGLLVNQHLGEASSLWIYGFRDDKPELMDRRPAPMPGGGDARWEMMAGLLCDCGVLLVNGIGKNPNTILERSGIHVVIMEGLINDAAERIFTGRELPKIMLKQAGCAIGECAGTGMGCG